MARRVIAVINQKGGVGKTTTTANLSHALAMKQRKLTLIDLDPQGHLAVSLGIVDRQDHGIDEVMLEHAEINQFIRPVRENLNLITAGNRLKEIEQLSEGGVKRGDLLRTALSGKLEDQDMVMLDCPPSSGLLVANALFAADEILIPMSGDFLSLQGLSHMMATIKNFEQLLKRKYKILLVMSRYVTTRKLSKEVLATITKHFPGCVLSTLIRETAVLAECAGVGKTILEYKPGSRSARDFRNLAIDFEECRVR